MSGSVEITDEELGLADDSGDEEEEPNEELQDHPVPEEMQDFDQWVCWELSEADGRELKMPRVPDGSGDTARTDDPATWDSFEETTKACRQRRGLGIGFVLTEGDPFLAVDFDDVRDPDSGEVEDWVLEAIEEWNAYTEVSPSGTGIHVWLKDVDEPEWWVDTEHIEVYDSGQYITVTGEQFSDSSTTCTTPSNFIEWLQSHTDEDQRSTQETESTTESNQSDIDLRVYDVLSQSSYREEERVSHPYHDSSTGANFKVFSGGETWHCFRHDVTGNAFHLLGMETGVISCADWKNRDLTDQEWAELFDAGREAGYDIPDHPEQRDRESTQANIPQAIIESPSDWIWPEEQNIIARPVDDLEAHEVKTMLEEQSLDSDAVVEIMAELEDEYSDAFNEFWQTPEEWSVSMEGPDHNWREVRGRYSQKGQKNAARDLAVRLLREEYDFVTVSDNEQMYCYNPETGVYESDAKQVVKARLEEMLQLHYSSHESREIIGRLKAGDYIDREEFGQSGSSVCVANGVVDIETGEMSEFSSGYYFRSRLPVEYDPDADCTQFREYLEDVCPADNIPLLQEFVGYCLQPQMDHKKGTHHSRSHRRGKKCVPRCTSGTIRG